MVGTPAERYIRLGLQLDRHVSGIVDSYAGPAELAAAVQAAAPVEPATIAADADALLAELDDGWLRDQVAGLRVYASVLAGEERAYADEVEACFGVRPTHTDEARFAEAHDRLEELLPGSGSLADRYRRWESSYRVPPADVERLMRAVVEEARTWTRELVDLPVGEEVVVEAVRDEPWLAFCEYLGALRSRISVNVDLPISAIELLTLSIHETYAGHHTERCLKEQLLVQERGLLEETIVLVPTPQSLVSEGIAELATELLLGGDARPALAGVLHDAGVELDLDHALAVERALAPCRWVDVNASLLLHEQGASEAETVGYIERWALQAPERAAHAIRFFREPTSRTYVVTYAAGRQLCRTYVAGSPDRFRRLLTEQVRVGDLVAGRGEPRPYAQPIGS